MRLTAKTALSALALAGASAAPASAQQAGQAGQPAAYPEPAVRRSGNHSGIGTNRMNIDLVSDPVRYRLPGDISGPITIQPYPLPGGKPQRGPTVIYRPGTGVVVDGSGISINGTYTGDKWKVGFNLGTGRYPVFTTPWCGNPLFGWRPYYWGASNGWYGYYGYNQWNRYYDYYGARPVGYSQGPADPRLWWQPDSQQGSIQIVPAEPPTTLELAANAIDDRRGREAVRLVKSHVDENPSDVSAQRLLAVALINDAKFEDGVAVMNQAYRTDPALANEPMLPRELGLTEQDWRTLLTRTVTFAHRTNSSSAWLTVAAFMQAEGRDDVALEMVHRAEAAGLERSLVDRLVAALGG